MKGCQGGWALEHTACEERLREQVLFRIKKRKQREAQRQSCCLKPLSVRGEFSQSHTAIAQEAREVPIEYKKKIFFFFFCY